MSGIKKPRISKTRLGLGLLAIVIVSLAIYVIANHHKKSAVIPSTSSSQDTSAKKSSISQNSDKTTAPGGNSNTQNNSPVLIEPLGNFVSNHKPGQNGSNNLEVSTCNTTSGASCYIKFTNAQNGEVRVLSTQVTDSSGSTGWTWDIGQAGFTSGTWKIVAVANLGGQTKTTQDVRDLIIQ